MTHTRGGLTLRWFCAQRRKISTGPLGNDCPLGTLRALGAARPAMRCMTSTHAASHNVGSAGDGEREQRPHGE